MLFLSVLRITPSLQHSCHFRNTAIFLLYRILFLFYAEARGLLPMQDANYQQIGIDGIVEDARLHQQEGIHDPDPFSLWKRLTHLFVVVDDGDESAGVRPYNGGLFSDREREVPVPIWETTY
jgi:hypothetical protein